MKTGFFLKAFGTGKEAIRKNCIILPSGDESLFNLGQIYSSSRGMFFNVTSYEDSCIIRCKNRVMAGDAVLLLEETECRRVFLFGACGGITADIGELLLVRRSLNLESFSSLLYSDTVKQFDEYMPSVVLSDSLQNFSDNAEILKNSSSATLSSLFLEESKLAIIRSKKIDCVDMESSMVFSACEKIRLPAAALMYVTDMPGKMNFYEPYIRSVRQTINSRRAILAGILKKYIFENRI